jgi:hypothetical protein
MKKGSLIATAFLAALALAASPAAGEEKTASFAPDFKDGEAWQAALKTRIDLILSSGKENEEPAPLTVGREEEWVFRIFSADKGIPAKAEKEVRRSAEIRECPLLGGKTTRPDFPEGKTFSLDFAEGAPRAAVSAPESDRGAAIPARVLAGLEDELRLPYLAAFPSGPVTTGTAWSREGKDLLGLLRRLGLGPAREGKCDFRLAELSLERGAAVATIELVLSGVKLREEDGGMEAILDGKGTLRFDLDKGRIAGASLKGGARASDPATGLSGKGTFELSFEMKKAG